MRIGIDLGGTKIEAIALDDDGTELLRERVSTPVSGYEQILDEMVKLVLLVESKLGMKGTVGIGIPGTISTTTHLVKNANTVALIGHPLDRDLARLLSREVRIANDANCFALSEATDGAAKGAQIVFGVIVGTGCGGGVVVDGKVLTGINSISGEWGHNRLPDMTDEERENAPKCFCGFKGCNELFLSGTGLALDHKRRSGEDISAQEIAARAQNGDREAIRSIEILEERMARALSVVINILDPHVIVLGGGISNIGRLYENVPKIWGRYVFSDHVDTKLVKAKFGDSSGVRGAAWLWPR
ncbi:MAG: ROK family protein [Oligoflexales bacterium]|nr:ROK family protein [Oligoflexales bacterium]